MQDLIRQIEMGEGFSVHSEKEWAQFIKYYNKTYKRAKKIAIEDDYVINKINKKNKIKRNRKKMI
jgi:hypothetical protein